MSILLFIFFINFYKLLKRGVYSSNALIIHGINIENAITMGNILDHMADISWSYRNRGNSFYLYLPIVTYWLRLCNQPVRLLLVVGRSWEDYC